MNWLHDTVVDYGLWSPKGVAQPIIEPALAAAPAATVTDASAIVRFWFDRFNPAFDWRTDLPTYVPAGETMFFESRAAPRVRIGDGVMSDRWPWLYRRFGVLLVTKDLRRHYPELADRQAAALRAIHTVESWTSSPWRSTAIVDDPRWVTALYLVGDRGERAPALIGAGALAVRADGRLAACDTPEPDQTVVAARTVAVTSEPRSEESDAIATGTFERLLAPLLFANALLHVDNEPVAPLVAVAISSPSRAERLVVGPEPSRHVTLSFDRFPARLDQAGADQENGLAAALRACRDVFVTTAPDERNAS